MAGNEKRSNRDHIYRAKSTLNVHYHAETSEKPIWIQNSRSPMPFQSSELLRGNPLRKRWKRIIIIGHVIPDPFTGLVPITRGPETHKTRPTFAQRFPRRAYPAENPAPLVKLSRIAARNSFPRRPGLFTASKNALLGLTWPQSEPLLSKRKINRGCAAFNTGTHERSQRNKKISSFASQPRFQFSQFRLSTVSTVSEISQGLSDIFGRAISYGGIFSVATRSFLSPLILLVLLSLVEVTKYARVSRLNGRHLFLTRSITPFLFDFHRSFSLRPWFIRPGAV